MKIRNLERLIGDSVGTVPVMLELARQHGGFEVETHPDAAWLYELLPGITVVDRVDGMELDIHRAFAYAGRTGCYMTQAWYEQLVLEVPVVAPRPVLEVPDRKVPVYDYVFAPFGRSAPEEQKWGMGSWCELTNLLPNVCILGNSRYDTKIDGCVNEFDRPMVEVLNILRKCRKGCVSIVTGISHLCFAMGTKNWLLNNQGFGWGVQPEAVSITKHIPDITVEDMLEFVMEN